MFLATVLVCGPMREYDEKRSALRMHMDCPLQFSVQGEDTVFSGHCVNLSIGGALFTTDQALEQGTRLSLEVVSDSPAVSPLSAEAGVVRVSPRPEAGGYEIAVAISKVHS